MAIKIETSQVGGVTSKKSWYGWFITRQT